MSFTNDKSLTTSSSRDSLTLPPVQGSFIQVFEVADLGMLYAKHVESQDRLQQEHIIQTSDEEMAQNTIYYVLSAVKKQNNYVKTIPFWQFRGVYWYFVICNALANKPVLI